MISRPEAYVLMRPGVAPSIEEPKVRAVGLLAASVGLLAASVGLLAASVGLLAVDAKASPDEGGRPWDID
jgi:hypothetical protein